MAVVEFEEGTLRIDAAVIGQGLNVEPSLVQARMREGKITVLCELYCAVATRKLISRTDVRKEICQ
jgi:Family of unknown function (DUF6522)